MCWLPPPGHPGGCRARCVYPERASQFLHKKASRRMRRRVESERERVFIRGTTQLATVETKTRRTAIRASSTLISFPKRVRAVAFSSPSNWTTCCCCCWSSILEILVWHASNASCRGHAGITENQSTNHLKELDPQHGKHQTITLPTDGLLHV